MPISNSSAAQEPRLDRQEITAATFVVTSGMPIMGSEVLVTTGCALEMHVVSEQAKSLT